MWPQGATTGEVFGLSNARDAGTALAVRQAGNQTIRKSDLQSFYLSLTLCRCMLTHVRLWVITRLARRATEGSVSPSAVRVLRVFALDSYELRVTSSSSAGANHVA